MVEEIIHDGEVYAIIVRDESREPGVHFFTPDAFPQQLAYMRHAAGSKIAPHVHNPASRTIEVTSEVLIIKRGSMRIDFYGNDRRLFAARHLSAGDAIVLVKGGHGFEALDELEMFEVKQGPFGGAGEKTRFEA
jgi:hypothetical protein